MSGYRLITLGALRIETASGEPVDLPAGKPLALLVRLAIGPEAADRRELAHLLWPRSSMERGLQSVRQAIWLLRKALGEEVLEATDVVRLGPGVLTSDAGDLLEALEEDRVPDAAALWNGPFLNRFAVADAPEWDRWVEGVHEDLTRRLSSALFDAAARRREAGDVAAARKGMERAVEISPFEPHYREELVTFLVELRDLRAAEKALAEARQALEPPEQQPVLERLARRVEQLRQDRSSAPDERFSRPDLVGRSAELADLMALWRRTEKGDKRLVLLTGPAGIGKTRLADELSRTVQHENAATLTVRAAEAERSMEYGVVASLVRALLQMSGAAGISTASDMLLRGLAPSLPLRAQPDGDEEPDDVNAAGLSDALADLIGAIAWERPLLITVDDAGWADASSVAVLSRALRTLREGPVMVVLTARTSGGVGGVLHPLEVIGGDVAVSTIRLRPLTRPETRELVALLVDLPDGAGVQRLLDRIHATTGGNPFYVIELIRAFLDERLVAAEDGHLVLDLSRLDESAPWPKNVRALVRRRFERLSPQGRALGHLVATVTPREPETAAKRLAGLGRRAYAMAVAELIEHGIVAWDGNTLVFTHGELREAAAAWVEEGLEPRRRWWSLARIAGLLGLGVVAVLLVLRFAVAGASASSHDAPPYGGGTIVLGVGDSILTFRGEKSGDSVAWRAVPPPFPVAPAQLDRLRLFRTVAGVNMWFRHTRTPTRGPDVVRVDPTTGGQAVVVSTPGDDVLYAISPDGAWILFGSDDTTTLYSRGIYVGRSDGTDARLVSRSFRGAAWSRDGRYLLAVAEAQPDTVLVLTPAGRVLARQTAEMADVMFCGNGDRVLIQSNTDRGSGLTSWNWKTGESRLVSEDVRKIFGCSPDGQAAFVEFVPDRTDHFGILDLETKAFHDLGLERVSPGKIMATWLADSAGPVPSRLSLDVDSAVVDWGGTDILAGRTILSDGSSSMARVEWSSSDSSVATVSADGVLKGNQPGGATIRGCVDDWICDTLHAVVLNRTTTDLLFEDRFPGSLDTARWIPFGDPPPRTVRTPDGESVLFLNGDGVWVDGIMSRDTFSLELGATLELEFRYRGGLHRTDRQTANFCLVRYEMQDAPPPALADLDGRRIEEGVCATYPAQELKHFDPQVAVFTLVPGPPGDFVRDPDDLPPESWTHLAIQVLPNGQATLILNRRVVQELSILVRGTSASDWRIELAGHSLDTRLEVRYVTLWQQQLY